MGGRTDGRTDGWMDGWMDGWTDGQMNENRRAHAEKVNSANFEHKRLMVNARCASRIWSPPSAGSSRGPASQLYHPSLTSLKIDAETSPRRTIGKPRLVPTSTAIGKLAPPHDTGSPPTRPKNAVGTGFEGTEDDVEPRRHLNRNQVHEPKVDARRSETSRKERRVWCCQLYSVSRTRSRRIFPYELNPVSPRT